MFVRIGDVIRQTGLAKSTIYQKAKEGEFPKPHRISHRVSVWKADDVRAWLNQTARES